MMISIKDLFKSKPAPHACGLNKLVADLQQTLNTQKNYQAAQMQRLMELENKVDGIMALYSIELQKELKGIRSWLGDMDEDVCDLIMDREVNDYKKGKSTHVCTMPSACKERTAKGQFVKKKASPIKAPSCKKKAKKK